MGQSHFESNSRVDFGQHLVPPKLAADAVHSATVRSLRDEVRSMATELELERRERASAERANRAKMDFVARLSHELRTPLNAIAGYADLLLAGIRGALTAEQAHDVGRIQLSERHLVSIVDTIADYAKLEVGAVQYVLDDVPVLCLLEAAEAMIAPQLAARDITLQVLPVSPHLRVVADADKVSRILVNLLTNAVKFTPPGERILLSAAADGAGVAIRVTDFGPGIPADVVPAIFEPYVLLAPGATGATGATGLGLAIARDLALGMGGDVTVTSTVDMGSSFVLHLPALPDAPAVTMPG